MSYIDSASSDRVKNNVMRHEYRVLGESEKASMKSVKNKGQELLQVIEDSCQEAPEPREITLAKTRLEEAVMWAVKHITR